MSHGSDARTRRAEGVRRLAPVDQRRSRLGTTIVEVDGKLRAAALLAAAASPAAAAAPPEPPATSATAVLSTAAAGARHVALTVRLRGELQCGRLNAATVTLRLPAVMHVPRTISTAAVRVGGAAPAHVATSGTTVVISPAPPKDAICDVIGPGVALVSLSARAGLGNPPTRGAYRFSVVTSPRGELWRGIFAIR